MRNAFVKTLQELAVNDKNLFLITGDLGYGVLDEFKEKYPKQFINAGISEQNMTSVAAGMALEGNKVFSYSIGNFPTLRCLEQIRNDVAYHKCNVKIVSIGAGMAYGGAGMSHHATEDIAIMRAIPNMVVFSPADVSEAVKITKAAYEMEGCCYLRLGKGGESQLHSKTENIDIFKAVPIIEGKKICIFSTGAITSEAYKAALKLNEQGISTSLYSFPMIKPIDIQTIERCAKEYEYIVTVEEHSIIGGLGGAVAEVISELPGLKSTLKRIGIRDQFSSIVGTQDYLRDYYGISENKIVEQISKIFSL